MMALFLLLAATPDLGESFAPFYIGTYTSANGSKGIYRSLLNLETGAMSEPKLSIEAPNPSFLAIHGKVLFAVNESSGGEASAFRIEGEGLARINTVKFNGGGPCHLAVDPAGKNLLIAAYGAGTLTSLPILAGGALGEATANFQNAGTGPNRGRQEGPHMHAVAIDPRGQNVYACDLGTDEVLTFKFDASKGTLELADPRAGRVPPGSGARHLAVSKNGKYVYVNSELTCTLSVFSRDAKSGKLALKETVTTLPEGVALGRHSTAEILLHPSGKWLYVTNRGHHSVAAFRLESDGSAKLIEVQPAGVEEPRGAGLDPSGKWLVVAGQNSHDLASLRIDPKTGALEPTGHRVAAPTPVCIAF